MAKTGMPYPSACLMMALLFVGPIRAVGDEVMLASTAAGAMNLSVVAIPKPALDEVTKLKGVLQGVIEKMTQADKVEIRDATTLFKDEKVKAFEDEANVTQKKVEAENDPIPYIKNMTRMALQAVQMSKFKALIDLYIADVKEASPGAWEDRLDAAKKLNNATRELLSLTSEKKRLEDQGAKEGEDDPAAAQQKTWTFKTKVGYTLKEVDGKQELKWLTGDQSTVEKNPYNFDYEVTWGVANKEVHRVTTRIRAVEGLIMEQESNAELAKVDAFLDGVEKNMTTMVDKMTALAAKDKGKEHKLPDVEPLITELEAYKAKSPALNKSITKLVTTFTGDGIGTEDEAEAEAKDGDKAMEGGEDEADAMAGGDDKTDATAVGDDGADAMAEGDDTAEDMAKDDGTADVGADDGVGDMASQMGALPADDGKVEKAKVDQAKEDKEVEEAKVAKEEKEKEVEEAKAAKEETANVVKAAEAAEAKALKEAEDAKAEEEKATQEAEAAAEVVERESEKEVEEAKAAETKAIEDAKAAKATKEKLEQEVKEAEATKDKAIQAAGEAEATKEKKLQEAKKAKDEKEITEQVAAAVTADKEEKEGNLDEVSQDLGDTVQGAAEATKNFFGGLFGGGDKAPVAEEEKDEGVKGAAEATKKFLGGLFGGGGGGDKDEKKDQEAEKPAGKGDPEGPNLFANEAEKGDEKVKVRSAHPSIFKRMHRGVKRALRWR